MPFRKTKHGRVLENATFLIGHRHALEKDTKSLTPKSLLCQHLASKAGQKGPYGGQVDADSHSSRGVRNNRGEDERRSKGPHCRMVRREAAPLGLFPALKTFMLSALASQSPRKGRKYTSFLHRTSMIWEQISWDPKPSC